MAERSGVVMGSRPHFDFLTPRVPDGVWPDFVEIMADALAIEDHWVRAFAPRGWPREVKPGWLAPLLQFPFASVVSVSFHPMRSDDQVARLTRRLIWNQGAQRMAAEQGRLPDPVESAALADATDLREELARGETRLMHVGLAVALKAPSHEQLDQRAGFLTTLAGSLMLPLRACRFQQREAWQATLPGGMGQRGSREMDTRAAATLFPLMGDDVQHLHGQVWGENPVTRVPIVIDRRVLPAPHSLTVAWSGAGKSYATKLLALRARYHGISVIVIDPEGEYRSLASDSGVLRIGQARGLNPLALKEDSAPERARRADFGVRWLEVMVGQLPSRMRLAVQQHLRQASHLTPLMWSQSLARDLPRALERVRDALDRWTSVMGDDSGCFPKVGLTVFDLSEIPPGLKVPAYLVAVEHILATLTERSPRWVIFDEAWHLLGNAILAPYLEELYRRARKWGTALTLVTQDAHDTLRSAAAQVCLRNSPLVLLLRPHADAVSELARVFRLSRPEAEVLESSGVGEGLLLVDRARVPIRISASPYEDRLIREAESYVHHP